MPCAKSLSSGPRPATHGPTSAKSTSAATMPAPAMAERLLKKRARARASSTALPPSAVREEGDDRAREGLRALLGRRRAAIEYLEAGTPELARQPPPLLHRR